MEYLILVVGLALIIIGATMLTDGSVALAERFHVPEFIVGLTIVAIGTSMPELTVSFLSAIEGSGEMAIGNVIGSNIFNIFAVLGVCALIAPISFTKANIRRDIPICIIATLALLSVTAMNEDINRTEGIVLLLGYAAMMWYMFRSEKQALATSEATSSEPTEAAKPMAAWRIPIWILAGLGGLIYGGQLSVDSATEIARSLGVSEATIAITLIAGGTSLPELASSLVSLIKGRTSLALGNVLGSNIANILLILGTCSTVTPLSMGNVTMFDIYVAVFAVAILMLSAIVIGRDKLTRFEGVLFLGCYVAYLCVLLGVIKL